jgi:hypothetical protein
MRLDEKGNQLRLFVPRDENGQKDAFAICLAKEMIRFLGLPETKSWGIITAVLTIEPQRLDSFLHRQGIVNSITAPSHSNPIKEDAISSNDETTILDEKLRALTLSFQQSNNGEDEVSAPVPLTPSVSIVRSGFANTTTDIDHKPITNGSSSHGPLHTASSPDIARQEEKSELQSAASPPNSKNAPRTPRAEQDFQLQIEKVIQKARNSKPESFSLVSSQPRGSGSSVTSEDTGTSITSSDFDAASYSSAATSNFEEADIFDTPSKKTKKTRKQQNTVSTPGENHRTAGSPSPGRKRNNQSSPSHTTHQGPDSKLGFLGEQYIVEFLKHHIDDFDENIHWASKLRCWAGLPSYGKSEDTDIEYQDTNGSLSKLLSSWARGGVPNWLEEACMPGTRTRPKYWLEVKTTKGSCETPFFVTEHQHALVSSLTSFRAFLLSRLLLT